jgi:hypothetical protein
MATHGATRERVIEALRATRPFKTSGSLRGVEGTGGTGLLAADHQERYRVDRPVYTVYSYDTPIAWVTRSGLVRVPDVNYSVTTSAQQNLCRVYLNGGTR